MTIQNPVTDLQPQFSNADATATPWDEARQHLEMAEVYWLTTVRPERRPHVTPLVAVWMDGALYFCTGPNERKARNLILNPHCIITTGCNTLEGLDLVVEGDARLVSDRALLQRVADRYAAKYAPPFHFTVRDGGFDNGAGGIALVYEVTPTIAFGFAKGRSFSQTRWRFD